MPIISIPPELLSEFKESLPKFASIAEDAENSSEELGFWKRFKKYAQCTKEDPIKFLEKWEETLQVMPVRDYEIIKNKLVEAMKESVDTEKEEERSLRFPGEKMREVFNELQVYDNFESYKNCPQKQLTFISEDNSDIKSPDLKTEDNSYLIEVKTKSISNEEKAHLAANQRSLGNNNESATDQKENKGVRKVPSSLNEGLKRVIRSSFERAKKQLEIYNENNNYKFDNKSAFIFLSLDSIYQVDFMKDFKGPIENFIKELESENINIHLVVDGLQVEL